MLEKIYIKNYVIIKALALPFESNFNVLTGETGAGKSIILGALSLILGERADSKLMLNSDEKCIIEGHFNISSYPNCKAILQDNDLDVEEHTIIRREISPQGKSRAFINDTPVNLNLLHEFTSQLVDLHRQFDNLAVKDQLFPYEILDALAGNADKLKTYQDHYKSYTQLQKQLEELLANKHNFQQELDYKQYLLNELKEFDVQENELETVAEELKTLEHAEEIQQGLQGVLFALEEDENAITHQLKKAVQALQQISRYLPEADALQQRMDSTWIELNDIKEELAKAGDQVELDPERLQIIQERLDTGYKLLKKHGVHESADLIAIRKELKTFVNQAEHLDDNVTGLEQAIQTTYQTLLQTAQELHRERTATVQPFEDKVNEYIGLMGMPNARFKVQLETKAKPDALGNSEIIFLLDSNNSNRFSPIHKSASGGELSRIMLAIKTITAQAINLPTLIFDEVDTGISGEAAKQVGILMQSLGAYHQIISITHQPQVAAKAHHHYFVYKKEDNQQHIATSIRKLDDNERVAAIAQMIGGNQLTDASLSNAKELMN